MASQEQAQQSRAEHRGAEQDQPLPATDAERMPITFGAASWATLCAVLWGGLAVAVRYTQEALPPLATAGFRFAIATALLAVTAPWQGISLAVDARRLLAILPVGLLLYVQIGTFHFGLAHTNSAHGSVLIGSYPVFVALAAHFALRGDRVSWAKLLGLATAFGGLLSIVAGSTRATGAAAAADPASLGGDAVILFSSMLIGVNTVLSKRALQTVGVYPLLFWSNLLATALFFVTSLAFEAGARWQMTPQAAWGLFYQGVVVAWLCFLIWTALLGRHRASQVSVFGFAQPLCGIAFGVWLRGDPMTLELALGGVLVAAGIVFVARAER